MHGCKPYRDEPPPHIACIWFFFFAGHFFISFLARPFFLLGDRSFPLFTPMRCSWTLFFFLFFCFFSHADWSNSFPPSQKHFFLCAHLQPIRHENPMAPDPPCNAKCVSPPSNRFLPQAMGYSPLLSASLLICAKSEFSSPSFVLFFEKNRSFFSPKHPIPR